MPRKKTIIRRLNAEVNFWCFRQSFGHVRILSLERFLSLELLAVPAICIDFRSLDSACALAANVIFLQYKGCINS